MTITHLDPRHLEQSLSRYFLATSPPTMQSGAGGGGVLLTTLPALLRTPPRCPRVAKPKGKGAHLELPALGGRADLALLLETFSPLLSQRPETPAFLPPACAYSARSVPRPLSDRVTEGWGTWRLMEASSLPQRPQWPWVFLSTFSSDFSSNLQTPLSRCLGALLDISNLKMPKSGLLAAP